MTRPDHPSDPEKRQARLPDGGAFAYSDEGPRRAPTYLLVHGLPGSGRDFRWLAGPLSEHGRVVRVDMPGFGGTPAATAPGLDVPARARFVTAVAEALALDTPVLVGHSMGGVVASKAVAEHPERFGGLALIASPGLRVHRALRRGPFRTIGALLASPPLQRLLRTPVRKMFAASGFRHARDDELVRTLRILRATSMAEHVTALAEVRRRGVRVFHAFCGDDPMIEAAIMEDTARALGGPMLSFPDGGHNPQKHHAMEIAEGLAAWRGDTRAGPR